MAVLTGDTPGKGGEGFMGKKDGEGGNGSKKREKGMCQGCEQSMRLIA